MTAVNSIETTNDIQHRDWPINEILLLDYVWRSVSDEQIARLHGVSTWEVESLRNNLSAP